jgi:hypothetical protein
MRMVEGCSQADAVREVDMPWFMNQHLMRPLYD